MTSSASKPVTRERWLVGAVAALLLCGPSAVHLARLAWMEHRLARRLVTLTAEERRLTEERDRLQHDATYVEDRIRTTFKWAKQGEYVIPLEPSHDASR